MAIEKPPCEQPDIPECKYSKRAAKEAVKETFAILGVDINDPKQVSEFQQDLRFGRSMRCLANKGLIAAFTALKPRDQVPEGGVAHVSLLAEKTLETIL